MSSDKQLREKRVNDPCSACTRLRGKYGKPHTFNIVVNDMSEVIKHQDAPLTRTVSFGIQSSLNGGFRVGVPGGLHNNVRKV